jgi:tape measure domain-containing protein
MSEVGSGQVAIFPTFKGFRSQVTSETSSAGREGGRTFSSAFNAGAGDPGADLVKKLNAQISSGSKALSTARLAEQDATGKVRIAEAALNEARAKGGEGSARAIAAEERLATAKRKLTEASGRTVAASDQLRQSQSKLAEAMSAAGSSGEQAASRYATGWSSLKQRLSGLVKGSVDEAGAAAESSADRAGRSAGGAFGNGFKALMGPALALAGAVGFSGFVAEAARASDATDKFKATMDFAGLDSTAITDATAAAKEYADQTVFDLPTIQNTIAQLASNGVKDYTGLTKAAGNLNAVAGGNAETFKSVSTVLTQTAGAGKLTTENWNQLADAIPGAAGPLMKSLEEAGAYTGNFRDAMADGQITSDEFNASLMKLGNDPVAVEAAKSVSTFEGSIGGLQATINSGLMGALDALKPAITGAINGVSAGLGATFGWIGNAYTGMRDLIVKGDFTGALATAFGVEEDNPAVGWILDTRNAFVTGLPGIKALITQGDFQGSLTEAFGLEEDSPAVGFILRTRAVLTQGIPALKDLLIGGNFTGAFREAFGVEEDAPIVDKLFTIRETVISVFQGIKDFVSGFTMPLDLAEQFAGEFNVMQSLGLTVRDVLGQLWAAISPLIPSVVELWSAVSPLGTVFAALQPFLLPLVGMIGNLALSLGGSLASAITGILPAIQTLQGVFISLFTDVLATVLPVVMQLVTMFAGTLASLVPILVPIVVQVATLAATLISQLAPIFMQLVSAVLPMVVTIFGAILQAIGPLVGMIAGVLMPIIQALMPVVVAVFSVIADVIASAMQIVLGIIQVVTGIISGNWDQVWTGIGNIFSGIWNTIITVVTGALQIVGQVVLSGLQLAGGFVSSMLGNIGGFFSDTWGNINQGVSGFIGDLLKYFQDLPGKITGALSGAGTLLLTVGQDIVQGLIDGASGMIDSAVKAIQDVGGAMLDGVKGFLGIKSPSRRFRFEVGQQVGEGARLGILDKVKSVAAAAKQLVTVPTVPADEATAAARRAAGGTAPGSVTNITINQVDDPIGTSHAVQRRLGAIAV